MIKRFFFTIVLSFTVLFALAQLTPKYSNEFLQIGVGSRAAGMGNAVIASCADPTAVYWNSSFLPNIEGDRSLFFMHSEYFAGIAKYDVVSVTGTVGQQQGLGLAYLRFGIDNIPNTIEMVDAQGNVHYDKITSFSAVDQAFFVAFAKMLSADVSIGGTAKIIRRKLGDFAGSWGGGVDMSVAGNHDTWRWGVVLRDATTTFNAWSYTLSDRMKEVFYMTGNEIPQHRVELTLPRMLLGVGKEFSFFRRFTFYPELDFDITWDGKRNTLLRTSLFSIDPHAGFELSYANVVFLRAGMMNIQQYKNYDGKISWSSQFSMGIGLKIAQKFNLDYAFTDIGNASIALYSHVISVHVHFSASKSSL